MLGQDSPTLELDAGFLDISFPPFKKNGFQQTFFSIIRIFVWSIAWLGMIIGLLFSSGAFDLIGTNRWIIFLMPASICIICGIILTSISPTKLSVQLHNIRKNAPPRDFIRRQESGGIDLENFWNLATINIPSTDDRGWVFESPSEEHWYNENPYSKDEGGIIAEHPTKIGTPKPATISTYGISLTLVSIMLIMAGYAIADFSTNGWECQNGEIIPILSVGGEDDDGNPLSHCKDMSDSGLDTPSWASSPELEGYFPADPRITYGIGLISIFWLGYSITRWKRVNTIIGVPTSLVRSVAIGNAELVGQVRKHLADPMTITVDNDPSKVVDDLYMSHWTYEVYICRRVSDGDGGTKEVCSWELVREKKDVRNFVLNDGTGGIVVRPGSWRGRRVELGQHLIQWECNHDLSYRGLILNLMTSGDIRKHRWTLFGLKIGDPIYLTGEVSNRDNKEFQHENIEPYKDLTRKSAALQVKGRDSPGFRSYLERGSELGVLSNARSQYDYLIPGAIAVIGASMILAKWNFAISGYFL